VSIERLIVPSLQGRAKEEEELFLRRWREAAAGNEQEYRGLAELWDLTGRAAQADWAGPPPDSEFLIRRAESEGSRYGELARVPAGPGAAARGVPEGEGDVPSEDQRSGTGVTRADRRRRRIAWGTLAAVFVAVGFGLGVLADRDEAWGPATDSEITTGPGELTTVTLSDGTAVRMGPSSQLRITQEGDDWVATLEGRAFFGVVPDAARTFTVRTRYGDAIAIGTRFEVSTEEEEFRVVVVEGHVRVSAADAAVDLEEGLMSRSTEGLAPVATPIPDLAGVLDWMGQSLLFRETPLGKAIQEIQRLYGVEVLLEDPALAEMTVTATFTGQGLDDVISVLCGIVGAECTLDEDRVRMRSEARGAARPTVDDAVLPVAARSAESSSN
jgi:transmembrane sensor